MDKEKKKTVCLRICWRVVFFIRSSWINRLYKFEHLRNKISPGFLFGQVFYLYFLLFFQQSVKSNENCLAIQFLILIRLLFVHRILIGCFVRSNFDISANSSLSAAADVVFWNKHCSKSTFALPPGYLSSIVKSLTCANWKMIDLWI